MKVLLVLFGILAGIPVFADAPSWWPQPYSVQTNGHFLTLSTPFYTVEHDLTQGGAISRIHLTHGNASNLLAGPIATRIEDSTGVFYSDEGCASPSLTTYRDGDHPSSNPSATQTALNKFITVECDLKGDGTDSGRLRLKTTYEYRWGYIKIHKEISCPDHFKARDLCPVSTTLSPAISAYGYRDGRTEKEGAGAFDFNSCRWGRLTNGGAPVLDTPYVPRHVMFLNPGVEGLEWFVSSDLAQWDLQFATNRGHAKVLLQSSPSGARFSVSAFHSDASPVEIQKVVTFDYYIGIPILEGHAFQPWFHQSFNRNKGEWVTPDQFKDWTNSLIQTVHCHNDGDAFGDGLFWRDGSYPPYPDMEKYNQVITNCHRAGIRTATYFSNKELHPSTPEYQNFGTNWARMNLKGELQHNAFNDKAEFGVQMCLRSGWLDYLKLCVDRVLTNHPLDGVYYDWNVALLCCNPKHQSVGEPDAAHWDMDELLNFMEWTRQRVGTNGLVIIHNTTTPMFCLENFASHVVAHEWGYAHWTNQGPEPESLPLEWSLVGARPRGVISYGHVDANAPPHLHRLFALNALVAGVTPWPVSQETVQLFKILKPLGDIERFEFADWRNRAVNVREPRAASAIYSRESESWLIVGNLEETPRNLTITLHPGELPHPLKTIKTADLVAPDGTRTALDAKQLATDGLPLPVPAESVVLIHLRQ